MSRIVSGDMLVDFLQLAGVWPQQLNPAKMGPDTALPDAVLEASRRLCNEVRSSEPWLIVSPDLAHWCTIIDPSRGGATPTDRIATLPVEGYEWTLPGPLYYTSGVRMGPAAGAVIFGHVGWYMPDPEDWNRFTFFSWGESPIHRWPGHYPRLGPGQFLRRGKAEFDPALAERGGGCRPPAGASARRECA